MIKEVRRRVVEGIREIRSSLVDSEITPPTPSNRIQKLRATELSVVGALNTEYLLSVSFISLLLLQYLPLHICWI